MLALLGFLTIIILLATILSRRVSPLTALVVVPVVASLAGKFGVRTAVFMVHGVQSVANVAGMFVFAILFFGVMTDAGLLDPIIEWILRHVGSHPPRIVVGTALLALLVHLDGSERSRFWLRFRRCCRSTSGWAWTSASWHALHRWRRASISCRGRGR